VPNKVRSMKQEQARIVAELRQQQRTWTEVAEILRERYGVNMRTALRLAHGWSQTDAADQWNQRWPAEPKTFKNFSYWERWPASTGYAPSLDVLARLAELYSCRVADLLIDCADYRSRDSAHEARTQLSQLATGINPHMPAAEGTAPGRGTTQDPWPDGVPALVERLEDMSVEDLANAAAAWVRRADPDPTRRSLLLKVSAALALASADASFASDDRRAASASQLPDPAASLAGIWHSRYRYYSSGRDQYLEGEHYVVFHQQGNQLIGESIPAKNESVLRLELALNGLTATGTWSERTSPSGYYHGRVYHGAIQLVIDPMGKSMSGKWVGMDREFNVNSDTWDLQWINDSSSRKVQRVYNLKV
jgi:hypothetical protein